MSIHTVPSSVEKDKVYLMNFNFLIIELGSLSFHCWLISLNIVFNKLCKLYHDWELKGQRKPVLTNWTLNILCVFFCSFKKYFYAAFRIIFCKLHNPNDVYIYFYLSVLYIMLSESRTKCWWTKCRSKLHRWTKCRPVLGQGGQNSGL